MGLSTEYRSICAAIVFVCSLDACAPQGQKSVIAQPETKTEVEEETLKDSSILSSVIEESKQKAEIRTESVDYQADGIRLKGYLAFDSARSEKRPGILVVHEWWGHNEYARKRARMLAKLGYTAFAVDMYGEGKQANHPDEAMQFMKEVEAASELSRNRFQAALDLLKTHPSVDPERTAAIGYCFGGGVVINMVRHGLDLDGVVMFHGGVSPAKIAAKPGTVKTKVLVCHGEDDPLVKPEAVKAFQAEMKSSQIDMQFIRYSGAKHAFTNPEADVFGPKFNLPTAYHPEADRESWSDMLNFLQRLFT